MNRRHTILASLIAAVALGGSALWYNPKLNPWRLGGVFHMTPSAAELETMIASIHQRYPDVTHVNASEVERRLASDPTIQLIDVREPDEFATGHIKGAVNIPVGSPDSVFLEKLDASKPTLIYCASGNRSSMLTRRLQSAGRNNITNFAGSMYAWRFENKPVE
jgi:rhodanese-related sulfurtransferase